MSFLIHSMRRIGSFIVFIGREFHFLFIDNSQSDGNSEAIDNNINSVFIDNNINGGWPNETTDEYNLVAKDSQLRCFGYFDDV